MTGRKGTVVRLCLAGGLQQKGTTMKRNRMVGAAALVLLSWAAAWSAGPESYKLGPGDVLEVSVWGQESLKRELVVPPDGMISFPLIRDVPVNGATVSQLRQAVTEKLLPFVPEATVTVMLLASKSLTAYVLGKVNRAGQFPTNLDSTVTQVLAMAGGFTPYASPSKIFVLRQADGKTVKIPFDYNQVVNGQSAEQDIVLQRGDVVVVP